MWAKAYLEQARSDWETFDLLQTNTVDECQELHYLQMMTEKIGKAARLRGNASLGQVRRSHKAFTGFLRVASRNSRLQQETNMNARQLREHVNEVLPIAYEIERLAPALANDGPNAEYPWQTPQGEVTAPASYAFWVTEALRSPRGRKLLKLITIILSQFDALF